LYRRLLQETIGREIEALDKLLTQPADSPRWAHELTVLKEELPDKSVSELLALWVEHHRQFVESVRVSKERDDKRGARTIADYADMHVPAAEDKVIQGLQAQQEEIGERVAALLGK
jgi:hypothetical protein